MDRPIASLSRFIFSPLRGSYEQLEEIWRFSWAKPKPIGSRPVKQWMGVGDTEITISGGIWPELQPEGTFKIEQIAEQAGRGQPMSLLLGSRSLGLWCVEEIKKTSTLIEFDAIPGAIEFEIKMSKD
ncbi:hypothetical protein BKI51_18830 [Alphaproteobacteria bacterium AO1-B]|nr:hypothetical protein BKI51_18830 [Alphaproteobacteria bacterium AO1-B]